MDQTFAKLTIKPLSKEEVLEKCVNFIEKPEGFFHVVSINPENVVVAQNDSSFRSILQSGDIQLIDGIGIVLASKFLGLTIGERFTGVDFMEEFIKKIADRSLRVLFLGGKADLAEKVQKCYEKKYKKLTFLGVNGIKNIKEYQKSKEGEEILQVIHDYKPHILFVSFGSPFQEKWLWENRLSLQGVLCAGVGGAFDFVTGSVPRAPLLLRVTGLEWLFRLVLQPWRWRRQMRLLTFISLVIKQRVLR